MATETITIETRAADLLNTQNKKFTLDMPAGMHQQLKHIAAAQGTNLRSLILEALTNYTLPRYLKEVK